MKLKKKFSYDCILRHVFESPYIDRGIQRYHGKALNILGALKSLKTSCYCNFL